MKQLKEWMRALIAGLLWRRVRINPNAKCPKCGNFNGRIQYLPGPPEQVIHQCGVCTATWADEPLTKGYLNDNA